MAIIGTQLKWHLFLGIAEGGSNRKELGVGFFLPHTCWSLKRVKYVECTVSTQHLHWELHILFWRCIGVRIQYIYSIKFFHRCSDTRLFGGAFYGKCCIGDGGLGNLEWAPWTTSNDHSMGLPAHKTRFRIFRFKMCCLQIFSLKQRVSMVTKDKIKMSSVLQILKDLVFKSSVLIIPQIKLIFSLQENTRGAPKIINIWNWHESIFYNCK